MGHNAILLVLIAFTGLLAYSNTFHVPFTFDDLSNIAYNPAIHSFKDVIVNPYHLRLVGYLSFALNYKIGGLNVTGYHIINLAVHVANALLVFWLAWSTLNTPYFKGKISQAGILPAVTAVALFSGLIFVAHPIQTQAVTYIVQRFTSLSTMFFLLSLLLYIRWRLPGAETHTGDVKTSPIEDIFTSRVRKVLLYGFAVVFALLAMNTKENAFTLPAVIVLWEFAFFNGSIRRRVTGTIPFLLMFAVIPVVRLFSDQTLMSAGGGAAPVPGVASYLFTQCRVIVTYLRLLVLPVHQNLDYDYPLSTSFLTAGVVASTLLLAALLAAGIFLYYLSVKKKSQPLLRFAACGIFWFFITLSVESSFIPIADVIFEHRLYLPSVGIIFSAMAVLVALVEATKPRFRQVDLLIYMFLLVTVLGLGVAALARNHVWASEVSLWSDTAAKSPNKARAQENLGTAYKDVQQYDNAISAYETALRDDPGFEPEKIHLHMGICRVGLGQNDRAVGEFQQAIDLAPDDTEAYIDLGAVYLMLNQPDKASVELENAVRLEPDLAQAHFNLSIALRRLGQTASADDELAEAIRLDPSLARRGSR